jgi:hypothetical protein
MSGIWIAYTTSFTDDIQLFIQHDHLVTLFKLQGLFRITVFFSCPSTGILQTRVHNI